MTPRHRRAVPRRRGPAAEHGVAPPTCNRHRGRSHARRQAGTVGRRGGALRTPALRPPQRSPAARDPPGAPRPELDRRRRRPDRLEGPRRAIARWRNAAWPGGGRAPCRPCGTATQARTAYIQPPLGSIPQPRSGRALPAGGAARRGVGRMAHLPSGSMPHPRSGQTTPSQVRSWAARPPAAEDDAAGAAPAREGPAAAARGRASAASQTRTARTGRSGRDIGCSFPGGRHAATGKDRRLAFIELGAGAPAGREPLGRSAGRRESVRPRLAGQPDRAGPPAGFGRSPAPGEPQVRVARCCRVAEKNSRAGGACSPERRFVAPGG
jgi:hypothetical protein